MMSGLYDVEVYAWLFTKMCVTDMVRLHADMPTIGLRPNTTQGGATRF